MGLPLLMALLAAGGVLLVDRGRSSAPQSSDPVQARLTQLGSLEGARSLEELELRAPFFDRTMRPLMRRLSGVGARLTSRERVGRTESRLAEAGYPYGMRTVDFLGLKVVVALVDQPGSCSWSSASPSGARAAASSWVSEGSSSASSSPTTGCRGGSGSARRRSCSRSRTRSTSSRSRSRPASASMPRSARSSRRRRGPLSDEFRRALAEVRIGKPRRDALREMVARVHVPALSSFIGAIIQAEQLGVAIARVLEVQSEQLRIERRQRAEEMAAKAPIKMLFPLIGCIFPSMFIVILGPALILIAVNLGNV